VAVSFLIFLRASAVRKQSTKNCFNRSDAEFFPLLPLFAPWHLGGEILPD